MEKPEHLQGNVEAWQIAAAEDVVLAERNWATDEPGWGIWHIPERELGLLPPDMSGMRCIELGCGTGYVSAWMARRGAACVGIDPTPNQLATANRLNRLYALDIVFEEGFGERVNYPDAAFDFAISEYGAALWADPYQWIPEAARILKPGGTLVFLTNSAFIPMCAPDTEAEGPVTDRLLRPYFGLYKVQWPDAPGQTEFHLTHGDWIALFRANNLAVERLVELRPAPGATTRYPWADPVWAQKWPTEDVWVLNKASF
ncbi:MAG: class I SAM-dependent methyltransferase [Pseudomonadota bacterium]